MADEAPTVMKPSATTVEGEHVSVVKESKDVVAGAEEHVKGEHAEGEHTEGEHHGEHAESEHIEGEYAEGEYAEGENAEGEHAVGEHAEGEHAVGEHAEGEHTGGDQTAGEHATEEPVAGESEGELREGESEYGGEEQTATSVEPDQVEEEQYVEEPPPDPTAPYDFSDSKEALKAPFQLRPEQLIEVEQLWDFYQDYTPAYSDLDGFITPVEAVYMLKCLLLLPYTPEQLQELIDYCCRPPHPQGYIFFDQFVKMVTIRQRDMPIEEELRSALKVMDPENTGLVDRENLREVLTTLGHTMSHKHANNLIKEVDISNDGTIGVEDVIGTLCIDLNREDIEMLQEQLNSNRALLDNNDF